MEIWGENGNPEASHRRNYTDRQHLRLLLLNKESFRLIPEKVSRILSQKLIFAAKRKLLVFVLCWLWLGAVLISFIRCRNCLSKWVAEGEKMLLQVGRSFCWSKQKKKAASLYFRTYAIQSNLNALHHSQWSVLLFLLLFTIQNK